MRRLLLLISCLIICADLSAQTYGEFSFVDIPDAGDLITGGRSNLYLLELPADVPDNALIRLVIDENDMGEVISEFYSDWTPLRDASSTGEREKYISLSIADPGMNSASARLDFSIKNIVKLSRPLRKLVEGPYRNGPYLPQEITARETFHAVFFSSEEPDGSTHWFEIGLQIRIPE